MSTFKKPLSQTYISYFFIVLGSFMAALSIEVFLYPNELIDGGIVGLSLILGRLTFDQLIPIYLLILNLPFILLAYKYIRHTFVIHMSAALLIFSGFLVFTEYLPSYTGGDPLEIIVIGGAILGSGVGLIIRHGGCLDGSEILGILINKRFGFTVGQVVLCFNFFVFSIYGLIFFDWHIAIQSLLTYIVAFKMMDFIIVGLDELKEVMVISDQHDKISKTVISKLGLGLTITKGRGGFSGAERAILTFVVERLDLSELKELILSIDRNAFITISNIQEVVFRHQHKEKTTVTRRRRKK